MLEFETALRRYLRNPDVARWLFSTETMTTVSPHHLDTCFVYAVGFNPIKTSLPRVMNIEDMLIVSSTTASFVLGVVWGLSMPHIFARTPLMLDKKPLTRRFAVDLSSKDALEFMEFIPFDDGKVAVVFRRFLHTRSGALPVIVHASLHHPSRVAHTLGPVLMRAYLHEAALCPVCTQPTRLCNCEFESYAPTDLVHHQTYTWNHFTSHFMNKARVGSVRVRVSAYIPNVGEMRVMDETLDVMNVMQRGDTKYLNLLRRKAVQGLGVNVVLPRTDSLVLALADENDYVNMHNRYVSRKRARGVDESESPIPFASVGNSVTDTMSQVGPLLSRSDSFHSVEDEEPSFNINEVVSRTLSTGTAVEEHATESQYPNSLEKPHQLANGETSAKSQSSALSPDGVPDLHLTENNRIHDSVRMPSIPIEDFSLRTPVPQSSLSVGMRNSTLTAGALTSPLFPAGFDPTIVNATANVSPEQGIPESLFDEVEALLFPGRSNGMDVSNGVEGGERDDNDGVGNGGMTTGSPAPVAPILTEPKSTSSVSSEDSATRGVRPTGYAQLVEDTPTATRVARRRAKPPAKRAKRAMRREEDVDNGAGNDDEQDDRKHGCTQCSSRFKMRGDLLRHVKIVHEGRKMFTCDTCGKAFGHSGHLNRHISSVHLQQRRFKCHLCGFQFFQASHLQSHIGHIHNAKKPVQCKICGLRVNSHAALKSHVAESGCGAAEVKENEHVCTVQDCQSKFSTAEELSVHCRLMHSALDSTPVVQKQRGGVNAW